MIDEKLLVLLGLGVAGVLVSAAAYQNDEDDCFQDEGYCDTGISNNTIINYDIPKQKQKDVSPLEFGSMVGGNSIKEPYVNSDYIILDDYQKNPDKIKVYNPVNDTVSLPVGDMTDVGVAENNKYIYDRTIGNAHFTSTKIGLFRAKNSDKIRGDLPIIPNKTGWFQTSADPATDLTLGAMNVNNGIADVKKSTSISVLPISGGASGVAHSVGSGGNYSTLADLQSGQSGAPSGVAYALGATPQPPQDYTVQDLINASINEKILANKQYGDGTFFINQKN